MNRLTVVQWFYFAISILGWSLWPNLARRADLPPALTGLIVSFATLVTVLVGTGGVARVQFGKAVWAGIATLVLAGTINGLGMLLMPRVLMAVPQAEMSVFNAGMIACILALSVASAFLFFWGQDVLTWRKVGMFAAVAVAIYLAATG